MSLNNRPISCYREEAGDQLSCASNYRIIDMKFLRKWEMSASSITCCGTSVTTVRMQHC